MSQFDSFIFGVIWFAVAALLTLAVRVTVSAAHQNGYEQAKRDFYAGKWGDYGACK